MEILKRLKFNRKSNSDKEHKIKDCKNTLDDLLFEFSDLIDKLYSLKSDIYWIKDLCLDYDSKIKLAIQKENINLAKKALQKKLSLETELRFMENKVNYLVEAESTIDKLLTKLEDEYENIEANHENNYKFKTASHIKNFSNIEQKIKDKFIETEEYIDKSSNFQAINIDLDEEIKKYI